MEDGKTEAVIFTNYQSDEDLKIGTREIKVVEFHESELSKIPSELLDHQELENVIFNDCRFTHVENLEKLNFCPNITKMTMKQCHLQTFPDFLSEFHALNSLNMSGNLFEEGSLDSITYLKNIEALDLSRCRLPAFPQVLCNLESLKELHIGKNNKIQNLPGALENLTNLETLDMRDCDLLGFPQVLCKLKSLAKLDISGNDKIQNLPGELKNLTNLEALDMWSCGLIGFPHVLCKLKSLKKLYIGWNDKIQNLPGALENLTNLETLDMRYCDLLGFPQALCKLKSLKELDIGGNNKIQNLPGALENLSNLETLDVWDCGLLGFPHVLCKLKSLKELDISGNDKIQNLPGALENLTNLETLNVWNCGLLGFPQVLCKLKSLKELNIGGNARINRLSWTIEKFKQLEVLDISYCQIKELPVVIFKMENLSKVVAENVPIKVLNEDFVKLWLQKPDTFRGGHFQEGFDFPTLDFVEPPSEIVQRGPKACLRYYRALRAGNAVNCNMLNVTLMGETGAGKSSLIHSIKEGTSVLVDPLDRTVVVDTLEVKHEDVLLKIADFGGHDVYQITCPLFLKSTKQAAIVAVKLPQYSKSSHSELLKKWLTTAASHMKSGSICIVATQCDLCSEEEVTEKMKTLKREVDKWTLEELSFSTKMSSTSVQKSTSIVKKIYYFQTSSLNMEGIKEVEEFLLAEAKSSRSVLPKRWTDVYMKMDEQADKDINFITKAKYEKLFRKTMPFPRSLLPTKEESQQCLQFLHDSGMVLWFGEKHEKLWNIVFHDPSFLISVLQSLFRHDLAEVLEYDHEQFRQYFTSNLKFQTELKRFNQTGILDPMLLRCIWKEFEFSQEVFETMVEMLTMLDLCYIDEQGSDSMLRLPWFVQDKEMSFLKDLWPEKVPPNTLQYTFTYCFCHRIPGVIYERFCVRLQRHLQINAHTRQDRKDAVYIKQDKVQILFQRNPNELEPNMQIHLRCPINNLLQLQKLCLSLHQDMDNLCMEYSGLYFDCYFLCPHCLLIGSKTPTKRVSTDIDKNISLEWVPCDPHTPESIQIPAALIFLRLFDTKNVEKHLGSVRQFCYDLTKDTLSTSDDLLLKVSKHVTSDEELHFLGNGLGLKDHEIRTIIYNNHRNINQAGYQVLIEWRKQKILKQISEAEMKDELKKVLLSDNVEMGQAVSLYF